MNSPYLQERNDLISKLINLYPYGKKWFETKSNAVLIALLNKKKRK